MLGRRAGVWFHYEALQRLNAATPPRNRNHPGLRRDPVLTERRRRTPVSTANENRCVVESGQTSWCDIQGTGGALRSIESST